MSDYNENIDCPDHGSLAGQCPDPKDCNAAVIPKEEILDAIYHCYKDRWFPAAEGKMGPTEMPDCALCDLLTKYGNRSGCVGCPIKIDSRNCHDNNLWYKYMRAISNHGFRSIQALRVADRWVYYLLDLYARVNQDKVNLPYLAAGISPVNLGKAAGKPEPVEKKKEWKLVNRDRIGANAKKSCEGVVIYISIDSKDVAYFMNSGKIKILTDIKSAIKISVTNSHEHGTIYYNTLVIYEYI